MRSVSIKIALALAVGLLAAATTFTVAQVRTPKERALPKPGTAEFANLKPEVLKVQGFNNTNIYMIAGMGANIAVQAGKDGVLVVDSGYPQMAEKVLSAIKELSTEPIRVLINTTYPEDHTGSNAAIIRAGKVNQAGPGVGGRANEADSTAHNNLVRILDDLKIPEDRWPVDTSFPSLFSDGTTGKDLYSNGEPVMIMHVPHANTDGDSMVFFRRSDVIVAGDLFQTTGYPKIELDKGGSINGLIEGLNRILDITVPAHLQEGGTMVIPGHGRISDEHDVLEYRDMVTIIRNRIQNLMKKGQTLAQIKAAKVTYEYEPRWGNRNPDWTSDMFVEAVYKSLQESK